ncbi:MAG: hypothetical protein MI923_10530 [Phycisphaerales bacterium]|nr:hypothetical protein [Phycisphaerales bacterium]
MDVLRWFFSVVLLVFFALVVVANYALILSYYFKKRRSSLILLIGGLAGAIGCALCPSEIVQKLWWIPLVADLGCAPILLFAIAEYSFKWFSGKSK